MYAHFDQTPILYSDYTNWFFSRLVNNLVPQLSEKNSFNEIFPDGWAILGSFMPHFKIPLNPPFPKGDDNGFSPLAKGS
jgi:hypothetical protein